MKLIRTVIAFMLGMVVGYAVKAWDVELPQDIRAYADKIESYSGKIEDFRKDRQRLEAEIERLKKLVQSDR